MRTASLAAACALALVLAAPAQAAVTCTVTTNGALTPPTTIALSIGAGDTAQVTTSLVTDLANRSFVAISATGCPTAVEATTVRTLTVVGTTGDETFILAPNVPFPLPAESFTDPWTVGLGTGGGDVVEVRTAGLPSTITAGAAGIALDADGDVELGPLTGVERIRLVGGAASDTLSGAGGNGTGASTTVPMTVTGNGADDVVIGGAGSDLLSGGQDADTVAYDGRFAPVTVRPGGGAASGQAGEGDVIGSDVEVLRGGAAADVLDASLLVGPVALDGAAGDDVLLGSPAGDAIRGGNGIDRVSYAGRTARVTSDPDGVVGDDGAAGEGDTVGIDVEGALGGAGDDRLVSSATPFGEAAFGGFSTPLLDGGPGGDELVSTTPATPIFVRVPIVGGEGADVITGGGAAEQLDGGEGPDVLRGGGGDDVLIGGTDGDDLDGGGGTFDRVSYETSGVGVAVDLDGVADDGVPGEGDNVRPTVEQLVGTQAADRLVGGSAGVAIDGLGGADVISGGPGPDRLDGGPGPDRIDGLGGDDSAFGDEGADAIRLGPGDDEVDASGRSGVNVAPDGADVLEGGTGRDVLGAYAAREAPVRVFVDGVANDGEAGEGDRVATDFEVLQGGAANDLLVGGPGDEEFRPASGSDEVRGGAGRDTYAWSSSGFIPQTVVTIRLDGLRNDGVAGENDLVGADVENADASRADTAMLIGNAGANVLTGTEGDDELRGGGGDDVLEPGTGGGVADGGPGHDVLDLRPIDSDDLDVRAPVSADLAGRTFTTEDAGVTLRGTLASIEEARGGDGPDVLRGGAGGDVLVGRGGADVIDGGAGDDELDGGDGADRLLGSAGADAVDGGQGADVLLGGAGVDDLNGGGGPDDVRGGAGADALAGGGGADALRGDAGPDALRGGLGADAIAARGGGRDAVDGGPGRDRATLDRTDLRRSIERVVRRLAAVIGG